MNTGKKGCHGGDNLLTSTVDGVVLVMLGLRLVVSVLLGVLVGNVSIHPHHAELHLQVTTMLFGKQTKNDHLMILSIRRKMITLRF